MFLGADGAYNSALELMHYFSFEFHVHLILLLIVAVQFWKAVRVSQGKGALSFSDLCISGLCVFAMLNALYFQGVVADVSPEGSAAWLNRVLAVTAASAVLFVLQIVFLRRAAKRAAE